MGQAKQRGSFEERRELAKQSHVLQLEQSNQDEIELAQKMVKITGCSFEKALDSVKTIRKQNDEKMAKLGYVRTGNTPDGIAKFERLD
jgi:hypothetical protein